jgi:leucyl/phenylalanyl-tRNA--protein transferase
MSDVNDIVAVGLDLKPKTLIQAYSQGVFPWPTPGLPLLWYSPQKRAILLFDELHFSKRLKQYLKKSTWTFTIDRAFPKVIQACSERGNEGTWILPEMKLAYTELFALGVAHSVEVWNGNELVGGLYGVDVGGNFAGESMFHTEDNASKAAVLFAVALLKKAGREFMDIQVMSEHMLAMGASEITRAQFKKRLIRIQEEEKKSGASRPFEDQGSFVYGDFSKVIE